MHLLQFNPTQPLLRGKRGILCLESHRSAQFLMDVGVANAHHHLQSVRLVPLGSLCLGWGPIACPVLCWDGEIQVGQLHSPRDAHCALSEMGTRSTWPHLFCIFWCTVGITAHQLLPVIHPPYFLRRT